MIAIARHLLVRREYYAENFPGLYSLRPHVFCLNNFKTGSKENSR